MKNIAFLLSAVISSYSLTIDAKTLGSGPVDGEVIDTQRMNLEKNTKGQGFGPQSPRDIRSRSGNNPVDFGDAPAYKKMNLCNIHFHKGAEHAGGQFTKYAGNGDGKGFDTGYLYSKKLSSNETTPLSDSVCAGMHGGLQSGDTIEIHYVHSSAVVAPGPTLGACLSKSIVNPQLRVEAQVFVLVNDSRALDFGELTMLGQVNGFHQAVNIPKRTGRPIVYSGSTTGPAYNEAGSPLQVTWSVRPKVAKVSIESVGVWCKGNVFKEDHAHGVRNLVTNPDLLSPM